MPTKKPDPFTDLLVWLADHGAGAPYRLRKPATAAQLAAVEALGLRLAPAHRALLATTNGWGSLWSYEILSCAGIRRWSASLRRDIEQGAEFSARWVPFAADSAGNLLCLEPTRRRVLQVDRQEGPEATVLAPSLAGWLRSCLAALESGALVLDEDGLVSEPTVAPAVDARAAPELPRIESEECERIEAAIRKGDLKRLEKLTAKTGLDALTWTDQSLIAIATEERQERVVTWMLDRGADVDCGKAQGRRTALFEAAWGPSPSLPLATLLLDRGADPNALTAHDGTPLHSAALWGAADIAALLLARGADRSVKDGAGKTAAMRAESKALKKLLAC